MIFCGKLKQSTADTKLIGPLFGFADAKMLLIDSFENGNDDFNPALLKCTLSKNDVQSEVSLDKLPHDYVVSGNISPAEALGGYDVMEDPLNGAPCYVNSNGFFLWRNGATDWVINQTLGQADPGVGRWYSCFLLGQYTAINGYTGTAVVQAAAANVINLVGGGLASFTLSAADTNTIGDLIISFENATEGSEIIFPQSFLFDVVSAENFDLAEMIKNQIIECDCFYDTTKNPWQIVVHKKGDPTTVYARKNAFDDAGNMIRTKAQLVLKLSEPTA